MPIYNEKLQCEVINIEYFYADKIGRAYFPKDNCCDMQGIIDIFTNIDPNVRLIETFANDRSDTVYEKSCGKWNAMNQPYVKTA